jgi:hypothetical protein
MLAYIIVFLFSAALFIFDREAKNSFLFWLYVCTMIFIAGFRDMIGGFDVYIYGEVYEMNNFLMFLYPNFELGFKGYYWVLKLISEKREFMFLASSAFFIGVHAVLFRKWSDAAAISMFVFFSKFFLYSFVYVRQGMALAIAFFALKYLVDKKYRFFALFVVILFFFHKSSVIFAPLLFIAHRKFNRVQLILLTTLVLIVGMSPLGSGLFSVIADQTQNGKLLKYAEQEIGINFLYVMELFILIAFAVIFRKDFYSKPNSTVIYNGLLLYIYVIAIGLTNATFIRLGWYYYFFVALALGFIFTYIKDKNLKIIFKLCVFLYFGLFYFRQLKVLTAGDLVPYKTIFETWDRNGDSEHYEYRKNE